MRAVIASDRSKKRKAKLRVNFRTLKYFDAKLRFALFASLWSRCIAFLKYKFTSSLIARTSAIESFGGLGRLTPESFFFFLSISCTAFAPLSAVDAFPGATVGILCIEGGTTQGPTRMHWPPKSKPFIAEIASFIDCELSYSTNP